MSLALLSVLYICSFIYPTCVYSIYKNLTSFKIQAQLTLFYSTYIKPYCTVLESLLVQFRQLSLGELQHLSSRRLSPTTTCLAFHLFIFGFYQFVQGLMSHKKRKRGEGGTSVFN